MSTRLLVTARAFWDNGEAAEDTLRAAGFEVAHSPTPGPYSADALAPLLEPFDAVIAGNDSYTEALFAACPRLVVVSRWGIGTDAVDLEAAARAGVVVTNTPGTTTEAVADYTFALMLGIARRIAEGDGLMRAGGWGELPGTLVRGKTLGLVGFGQIGQAVARRAAGFDMHVLAHDPYEERSNAEGRPPAEFVSLDDLLARSDFVSLHAAVTAETRGMFGAEQLGRMRPTAYLINTARGALVQEDALVEALSAGRIAGAALDVYGAEPLASDHPLRSAPRCLLTPHNAFNAVETARATSMKAAENVLDIWRGERPPTVRNPAVWESPALRAPAR
jgi:phosphoglycerate dehydrogenase-like enzyme